MLATGGLLGLLLMGAAVGGLMAGAEPEPEAEDNEDGSGEGGIGDATAEMQSEEAEAAPDALTQLLDAADTGISGGGISDTGIADGGTAEGAGALAATETAAAEDAPAGSLSKLLFGTDVLAALGKSGGHTGDGDDKALDDLSLEDPNDILREAGLHEAELTEVAEVGEAIAPTEAFQGLVEIVETAALGELADLPMVSDFDPETDLLVLDFEGSPQEAPTISLDTDTAPGDVVVCADDMPVTVVKGVSTLAVEQVQVVMTGPSLTESLVDDVADLVDDLPIVDSPHLDDIRAAVERLLDGGDISDATEARAALYNLFADIDGGSDALTGSFGDDEITGTQITDAIFGDEGNDTLSGLGGNDEISGDMGDDVLDGGDGIDFLDGGEGDDTLMGGAGADLAYGGEGDDRIEGGEGDDGLQGGLGADTILGGDGNDVIDGTFSRAGGAAPGDDDAGDLIDGGDGDDTVLIGASDTVTGGAGTDTFVASLGLSEPEAVGTVTDFDPGEDMIEIAYDPAATPDPVAGVEPFQDGTGAAITLNGEVVLNVIGAQGLKPDDIVLRPTGDST